MIVILDQKAIQLDKGSAILSFKAGVHLSAVSGCFVIFSLRFGYHLGRNSLSQKVSKIYGNGRSDLEDLMFYNYKLKIVNQTVAQQPVVPFRGRSIVLWCSW